MQLIVRGLAGKHFCLQLAEGDDVERLKVIIQVSWSNISGALHLQALAT